MRINICIGRKKEEKKNEPLIKRLPSYVMLFDVYPHKNKGFFFFKQSPTAIIRSELNKQHRSARKQYLENVTKLRLHEINTRCNIHRNDRFNTPLTSL